MGHTFNRPDEAAMLRILERHPHSPEGAILRLAWLEGLSRSEITELRWDQVDFEGKAIQLPDRTVPLEPSTETCLRERHVRCALRDPHVVISERSKKPMPPESISRLSRLALDRVRAAMFGAYPSSFMACSTRLRVSSEMGRLPLIA